MRYRIKLKPLLSRDADLAGVNAEDLRAVNKDDDGGGRRRSFNTAAAGRAERAADETPEKEARPLLDGRGRVARRPAPDRHEHDHADRAEPWVLAAADRLFAADFAAVGGF